MSDKFASYVTPDEQHTLDNSPALADLHYKHKWVNHSRNFVDPDTDARTQTIEGVWETRVKSQFKRMRGISKPHLPSYLDEFLWRSWFFPARTTGAQYLKGKILAIQKQ